MYRDSLGNTYTSICCKKDHHRAKPSSGGTRKYGRSKRAGLWRQKVAYRERLVRRPRA